MVTLLPLVQVTLKRMRRLDCTSCVKSSQRRVQLVHCRTPMKSARYVFNWYRAAFLASFPKHLYLPFTNQWCIYTQWVWVHKCILQGFSKGSSLLETYMAIINHIHHTHQKQAHYELEVEHRQQLVAVPSYYHSYHWGNTLDCFIRLCRC